MILCFDSLVIVISLFNNNFDFMVRVNLHVIILVFNSNITTLVESEIPDFWKQGTLFNNIFGK